MDSKFLIAALVAALTLGGWLSAQAGEQAPAESGAEAAAAAEAGSAAPSYGALDRLAWARVRPNGKLADGRLVKSVKRYGVGRYQVVLQHDVSDAVCVAAVGLSAPANPPEGYVITAPRLGNRYGVWVETLDADGENADLPFHLLVVDRVF